jgi:hypothetical protein
MMALQLRGTEDNYITNPGSGAFFVKINDFDSATTPDPLDDTHIIDGGVTVANVMTDSIQITTKVLETMDFSVGTVNPDNIAKPAGQSHGTCDAIITNDAINLGDSAAEFSLKTGTAYDGKSYWRLSSNSSNGATVYYSGTTLNNTVGDAIDAMDLPNNGLNTNTSAQNSQTGREQFGLALDNTVETPYVPTGSELGNAAPASSIAPLNANATYANGKGLINNLDTTTTSNNGLFFFDSDSNFIPAPLAEESADVVACATGKMRYVANIAASTPAGIYSTKINYLAAPQY